MGEYCNSASFSGSSTQTVSYIDHLTLVTAVVDLRWLDPTYGKNNPFQEFLLISLYDEDKGISFT